MKLSEVTAAPAKKLKLSDIRQQTPSPADATEGGLPFRPAGIDTGLTMPQGVSQFMAGAGKGMTDLARGAGQLVGVVPQSDIQEAEMRDKPLMESGAGKAGAIAGTIAAAAPTMFIPGANTYTGAALVGAGTGLLQPVAEGDVATGKAKNAAFGAAAGMAGQAIGQGVGAAAKSYATRKAAQQAAEKTTNVVRDATAAASKEAGYVIPPVQLNPSKINRALEGFAGKITTAQSASMKNQSVTNGMVKKALGLTDDMPLTPETLSGLRSEAGKVYEAMRGAGQIASDAQYADDLGKIVAKYQGAGKDFPELAKNEIADTVSGLQKPEFDSDSALDAISILRDKADKAFRGGDKAYGRAYKQMADSVEGVIERNVAAHGKDAAALLKDFRDARQLIAKTYSVESALNPATGNVNARKLAQQLAKGKPLSGDLKKVGRFAQAFPKAAEEVTSSMPGVSPLDYAQAAITSAATGNPGLLGTIVGRPLARSAILSQPYQNAMVNAPAYSPNLLQRSAPALQSDAMNALLRLGPSAYAAQQK